MRIFWRSVLLGIHGRVAPLTRNRSRSPAQGTASWGRSVSARVRQNNPKATAPGPVAIHNQPFDPPEADSEPATGNGAVEKSPGKAGEPYSGRRCLCRGGPPRLPGIFRRSRAPAGGCPYKHVTRVRLFQQSHRHLFPSGIDSGVHALARLAEPHARERPSHCPRYACCNRML